MWAILYQLDLQINNQEKYDQQIILSIVFTKPKCQNKVIYLTKEQQTNKKLNKGQKVCRIKKVFLVTYLHYLC